MCALLVLVKIVVLGLLLLLLMEVVYNPHLDNRKLVLAKINCPRHISTCIRRLIDWCGFI